MAYAIFKSGGKQYRVAAGDKLNVEKLDVSVGDTITSTRFSPRATALPSAWALRLSKARR